LAGELRTRLHQQVRQLEEIFGKGSITHKIKSLGRVTTAAAKAQETLALQQDFMKRGFALLGNRKSFIPTI